MKRTRSVTIAIEQRKLIVSITRSPNPVSPAGPDNKGGGTPPDLVLLPPLCPDCNSPWIEVTALSMDADSSGAIAVYRTLQQLGLHLHASPAGQLRICSKSLEEISKEEKKESH